MTKIKPKSFKKSKNAHRPKSRKEIRKENRKLKKQKRLEYYNKKKKKSFDNLEGSTHEKPVKNAKETDKQRIIKKVDVKHDEIQREKRKEEKLRKEMVNQRNRQLLDANVEEDKNIKRLEKQLKLNKRKSKSIPKSFVSEGLDYLLEICDENVKSIASAEQQFDEANDDFEEDFELMTGKKVKKQKIDDEMNIEEESNDSNHSEVDSEDDKYDDEDLEDDEFNDEDLEDDEYNDEDLEDNKCDDEPEKIDENESDNSEEDERKDSDVSEIEENNIKEDGTWEDIYGRLRSKDGSVLNSKFDIQEEKYVPPALRNEFKDDSHRKERLLRLNKQIKGLLNRLAEANMHSISNQIEELYMTNSRSDMNETITNLMISSLATNIATPQRLLLEHIMLITILHANVGTEIGAHFLLEIIKKFDGLFNNPQEVQDKTLDNIINITSQLYNFKIFDARLLYDILSRLSKKFDEKSIECILLILKNVGFSLRKDDPLALKSLILDVQKKAVNAPVEMKDDSRIKFMLDILLAIKNNNVTKIPNYDTTYSEHLKKILKGFIRKGNYVTQLKISLDDLLKAETQGKWWIVGSAWSGNIENKPENNPGNTPNFFSEKLLDLAKKHHMNTDSRRDIFCIIMSAEDYLDAFEKLLKLGLKNQQEREIIHVILHCCLQEKNFNPYYAVLTQKFCDHDRKFQMIIKYSIWDKLKALGECSTTQLSNLAKMLTHLFLEKGLSISILKIIQFGELDKISLRFIRQVLLGILLTDQVEDCIEVFNRVSQSSKLKIFRESLRLFIHHFLLKNLKTNGISEEQKELLMKRIDIVEKSLRG